MAEQTATGAGPVSIQLDGAPGPGSYQYVLRVCAAGRPATALTRSSRPFSIEPPPAPADEVPAEEAQAADPPPDDPPAEPPAPVPPPPPAPVPLPTLVPLAPSA